MNRTFKTLLAAALVALPVAIASAQPASTELDPSLPKAAQRDAAKGETVGVDEAPERTRGLLDVDPGTAAWSIVLFVILLAILGKFAWGPILKGLQDREGKIRHDLEHAENAAKQAAATLEEYRAQLATAHDEVRKIIDQGRADAERVKAQLTEQTQAEINGMRTRAQVEIKGAKEQAINEIVTQTTTLATDIAAKILRRQINLNPDDQRQLVQDSLAAASRVSEN